MADWADLILRTGVEHGFWPDDRQIVIDEGRLRPGVTDVMALRVGYEKLNRETGWEPLVSWEEGVLRTIAVVRRAPRALDRPGRLAVDRHPCAHVSRVLVTGGGGFVGSHLVERLAHEGHDVFSARRRDYDLTSMEDAGAALRRRATRARLPPRRRGRRDRREPRQPRPLLVRQPRHGRAHARAEPAAHGPQAGRGRHRLRLPEAHARSVPRGGALGRVPGGDERALRRREEGHPRRRAGVPGAIRARRGLSPARESLRPRGQLRPGDART